MTTEEKLVAPGSQATDPATDPATDQAGALIIHRWILTGHWRLLRAFVRSAEELGWTLCYAEDTGIRGGELHWWTLVSPSALPAPGPADGADTRQRERKISVTKSGRATERVSLLASRPEVNSLRRQLARAWVLDYRGHDGGWGGEPYYEVARRGTASKASKATPSS